MYRKTNAVEDHRLDMIDMHLGKEHLYKRSLNVVNNHADSKIYQKNLWNCYLAMLSSSTIRSTLRLSDDQAKELKRTINKKYQGMFLENLRDDKGEVTDEYYDEMDLQEENMENIEAWFEKFQIENSYTRSEKFVSKPEKEKDFKNKISQLYVESFMFNRVYEMMITKLIEGYTQEDLQGYNVKAYKTTTYDDLISGVDIIVAVQNHKNQRANLGIDHVCGDNVFSIEQKGNKGTESFCMDYNSSVRRGTYTAIPRTVWSTNPGISFLLFNRYLEKVAQGIEVNNKRLLDVYYEIQQANPKLYKESLDNGTEIDKNSERMKEQIFNLIK